MFTKYKVKKKLRALMIEHVPSDIFNLRRPTTRYDWGSPARVKFSKNPSSTSEICEIIGSHMTSCLPLLAISHTHNQNTCQQTLFHLERRFYNLSNAISSYPCPFHRRPKSNLWWLLPNMYEHFLDILKEIDTLSSESLDKKQEEELNVPDKKSVHVGWGWEPPRKSRIRFSIIQKIRGRK